MNKNFTVWNVFALGYMIAFVAGILLNFSFIEMFMISCSLLCEIFFCSLLLKVKKDCFPLEIILSFAIWMVCSFLISDAGIVAMCFMVSYFAVYAIITAKLVGIIEHDDLMEILKFLLTELFAFSMIILFATNLFSKPEGILVSMVTSTLTILSQVLMFNYVSKQ